MYSNVVRFIQQIYQTTGPIPLHEPKFIGNEKKYLNKCVDSTFVSSIGEFVDQFEKRIAEYTGAAYAIATSNATSALHVALLLHNVKTNDEVITQPLTFVATCNAINYCGASPVFIDVDMDTMGLSPLALRKFLEEHALVKDQRCVNKTTGKTIKACVPMHTFGHPCRVDEIRDICDEHHIALIEDAAESLGSLYKGKCTGTYGGMGIVSFNGNKIVTAGGGGCILTNNKSLAERAKHITTTAKVTHEWEYTHDMIGYNYRMPNLNAALLTAQLESLDGFIENKRKLADTYKDFFGDMEACSLFTELACARSNYWLNSLIFDNKQQRDAFLRETNSLGVMTRPVWTLMSKLPMFKHAQCGDLHNSEWLSNRVVNIPSGVTP